MYFHNVVGTGRYTTSTTNMYHKDRTCKYTAAPRCTFGTISNDAFVPLVTTVLISMVQVIHSFPTTNNELGRVVINVSAVERGEKKINIRGMLV